MRPPAFKSVLGMSAFQWRQRQSHAQARQHFACSYCSGSFARPAPLFSVLVSY